MHGPKARKKKGLSMGQHRKHGLKTPAFGSKMFTKAY